MLQGVPLVLIDNKSVKFPPRLLRTLAAARVTRIVLVPSLLRMLLTYRKNLQSLLPDLRLWISSGEPLSLRLFREFCEALPASTLLNLYGSSEVSADVSFYDTTAISKEAGRVPVGRPISNARAYVLDASLRPAPVGVAGEIHVGGAGVARGYLGRPALTAERFVPDPFCGEPGARMYRTGDLGRWLASGELEFLGRADDQVKVRGFRIEPGEVEAALEAHPAVERAVVTASRDDKSEATGLVGYLLTADATGELLVADELRAFLRGTLPQHMVPSLFIRLERLPLTPSGKVDRKSLEIPAEARSRLL